MSYTDLNVRSTHYSTDVFDVLFLDCAHGFYSSAKDQIDVLVEMHKNMTTMYKELVEYFCLDVKKTSMEEFFGDIKTFLDFYDVRTLF